MVITEGEPGGRGNGGNGRSGYRRDPGRDFPGIGAPHRVAAPTGQGLDRCWRPLSGCRQRAPGPGAAFPGCRWIRAFVLKGFGTVVTGTLLDGLREGDQVLLMPGEIQARSTPAPGRHQVALAEPGQRVAVNLAGK